MKIADFDKAKKLIERLRDAQKALDVATEGEFIDVSILPKISSLGRYDVKLMDYGDDQALSKYFRSLKSIITMHLLGFVEDLTKELRQLGVEP